MYAFVHRFVRYNQKQSKSFLVGRPARVLKIWTGQNPSTNWLYVRRQSQERMIRLTAIRQKLHTKRLFLIRSNSIKLHITRLQGIVYRSCYSRLIITNYVFEYLHRNAAVKVIESIPSLSSGEEERSWSNLRCYFRSPCNSMQWYNEQFLAENVKGGNIKISNGKSEFEYINVVDAIL